MRCLSTYYWAMPAIGENGMRKRHAIWTAHVAAALTLLGLGQHADAQSDCSSSDMVCTANCQMLPSELSVDCQTQCFKDRDECDRAVERARLQEQQRKQDASGK